MGANIEKITTGVDTSDATALNAKMIWKGYTAYAGGKKITGTDPICGGYPQKVKVIKESDNWVHIRFYIRGKLVTSGIVFIYNERSNAMVIILDVFKVSPIPNISNRVFISLNGGSTWTSIAGSNNGSDNIYMGGGGGNANTLVYYCEVSVSYWSSGTNYLSYFQRGDSCYVAFCPITAL